ncbi:methyltransferase domain-containing protein [Aromatoleum toluvorans]|uniref:Methyltransferase domain-containing protein n=1 Tax=Aromatoleum toluvorans TaxID=92002 RepID=A0ABX1PUD5_9RHOO|nr:class I SAM-dependent methyltransferase [Aromatoleum toluvorans]NMG43064.1 methyltransferase domain-containing protein [Aromatoleum toluvorans]
MERAEFDRCADEYEQQHAANIGLSGESPAYFARYKVQDVARSPAAQATTRILDFGAGIGGSVPYWREFFPRASLTCLDVSERSLAIARDRYPGAVEYCCFDGVTIPFEDGTFDVAFAACVFHHIDAAAHLALLRELLRTLADGGSLFLFEHNPLNPLTRHAVDTCPFDANAVLIRARTMRERLRAAGFGSVTLAYRIFFPGALRFLRPLEPYLEWLPLGAQYRLCARRCKP